MPKTREVLRLYFELKLGQRQLDPEHGTRVFEPVRGERIKWPLPAEMSESELENRLFAVDEANSGPKPLADFAHVREELQRHKQTTLQLLWEEYRASNPDGYPYSQFCHHYQNWKQERDLVLRQEHRPDEKLLVDLAGATIPIDDPVTGEQRQAQLFVAMLGASNYTYAETPASVASVAGT